MLSAFERTIAFRYLRARREEGLISVIALFSLIGIMLGVATLIVVLSVMNGVRGELIKSIIGLEGHVGVYAAANGIPSYQNMARDVAALPGVKHALPKVEGQVMLSFRGRATGAMVAAYQPNDLSNKPLLAAKISEGGLERLATGEGVVVGSRLAEKMGVSVDDEITLISPEGRITAIGQVPRVKAYPVVGLFSVGMFAYDSGLVLMPFSEAQIYFKLRDSEKVSMLEVTLIDPDQAREAAGRIQQLLPDYRVYDWKASNNHILQAVMVQRNVAFFIVMLIILVAAFNIISSLIMLVNEKTRQIAILRTLGASKGSIQRIFFACGASVGVIGTALGVGFGLAVAFNTESIQRGLESLMGHRLFADELYFLSHLPSRVDAGEVLMVVGMAIALSFLATLYPARKAASLDPAEALRYE